MTDLDLAGKTYLSADSNVPVKESVGQRNPVRAASKASSRPLNLGSGKTRRKVMVISQLPSPLKSVVPTEFLLPRLLHYLETKLFNLVRLLKIVDYADVVGAV